MEVDPQSTNQPRQRLRSRHWIAIASAVAACIACLAFTLSYVAPRTRAALFPGGPITMRGTEFAQGAVPDMSIEEISPATSGRAPSPASPGIYFSELRNGRIGIVRVYNPSPMPATTALISSRFPNVNAIVFSFGRPLNSITRALSRIPGVYVKTGFAKVASPAWLGYEEISFPIPIAIVLFAAIPLATILKSMIRRRRRRKRGLCIHCAYDLTGNVSGVCPECGTKT